jgi:hypothetical protein
VVIWERTLTFALALAMLGVYLASSPINLISDMAGGGLVVLLPFYLFPERLPPPAPRGQRNLKRALFYAVPAILCAVLAVISWPVGAIPLWPAVSYALVTFAYAGGGPGVFRKSRGEVDWAAAILLAPHIWASKSSLPYLRRKVQTWAQAAPNVYFGRLPADCERLPGDIVAVLDLTAEHDEPERLTQLEYRNIPVLDHTLPTRGQLEEAVEFIERHTERGSAYVHCTFGYSRSAGVVAAYLLYKGIAISAEDARHQLQNRRPQVVLSSGWMALLDEYRAALPAPGEPPVKREVRESSFRR